MLFLFFESIQNEVLVFREVKDGVVEILPVLKTRSLPPEPPEFPSDFSSTEAVSCLFKKKNIVHFVC